LERDELKEYLFALGQQAANPVLRMLIDSTLKYRDQLKWEEGRKLTVGDVKIALQALQAALDGQPQPADLTPAQSQLVQVWIKALQDGVGDTDS